MRNTAPSIGLVGMIFWTSCDPSTEGTHVSLASTAPDRRTRVEIVESAGQIDRNFVLRVTDVQRGMATNIFTSPDEGRPPSERVVWSRDSSRLLLLGRDLLVEERGRMPDGQQLYLLYDLKTGDLRCNASQQGQYKGFSRADVGDIEWADKIEL